MESCTGAIKRPAVLKKTHGMWVERNADKIPSVFLSPQS